MAAAAAPAIPVLVAGGVAALVLKFFSRRPPAAPEIQGEASDDGKDASSAPEVPPITLSWHKICCALQAKDGITTVKRLLKNLSGEAKAGRLLAIMGPSGSGKTTILNVLAGQLAASPRLKLTGLLFVNGTPCVSTSYKVAYVRQEDLFFSQLTVRETLSLAAELQLPGSSTAAERSRYVDDILQRLGLVRCADTPVGDAKVRGISGGEKKRLSIACELIASPSVIFADEPTTGLDAFQAEQVMETLKKLAQDGHTVVCSIHQPRGSIYSKFDDLLLLSEGSVIYAGPAQNEALAYFAGLGHSCPEHVNPAEFFADLISIDYSSPEKESASRKRVEAFVEIFATTLYATRSLSGTEPAPVKLSTQYVTQQKVGWWKQFRLLFRRAWLQAIRDGPTNKVRSRMSVAAAMIFGSIYWRMGRSQTSIQDRMGLLQVAAVNTAMAALTKTVNVFPKERAIVDRERAKGSYGLAPYLAAKLIAEMPIGAAFPLLFGAILYPMARLHPSAKRFGSFSSIVTVESFTASAMGLCVGAMVPTTEAAMALGPSLMTVFIVFGGYYVNSENAPVMFRWIPRVSLIRWAFQALCINEFKGLKFECDKPYDLPNGEQALERLGFGDSTINKAMVEEGRILLFWYTMTYALMRKNKPRYQRIVAPDESS
ncbi:ATP-binding cassette transporter [Selaginella moellendorffii]|uniref:ATP-binding cassette transporter n=2 Tax=Selaginella moellendorffii TaxID=88036 RepID=D8T2I5_SELML|nr:ABC transporter G family member 7 isoform X1 [Selaginella moellendorffii]EFJ09064.1 ATP-binding cassette transporter [Selaginella moellendorffii]|eukprot:XP_002989797.1 ABC transporter G family member 7 isoform X1 [Selaginella moellendorffii]